TMNRQSVTLSGRDRRPARRSMKMEKTLLRKRLLLIVVLIVVVSIASCFGSAQSSKVRLESSVETSKFGTLQDGTSIEMFTLKNSHGSMAKVITYGAILTELWVPDRAGKLGDVVLGFDNLEGYVVNHPYFGATVGRVANRTAKGKFTIDGKEYSLAI